MNSKMDIGKILNSIIIEGDPSATNKVAEILTSLMNVKDEALYNGDSEIYYLSKEAERLTLIHIVDRKMRFLAKRLGISRHAVSRPFFLHFGRNYRSIPKSEISVLRRYLGGVVRVSEEMISTVDDNIPF